MSKESIIAFSQAKAEPTWLQDLRQAAIDKLDGLALPKIERLKFFFFFFFFFFTSKSRANFVARPSSSSL